MRIIFAGTADFSVPALHALINAGHTVAAVYCQPDRKSGRGRKLQYGPVKQAALDLGISIQQPASLQDKTAAQTLSSYKPDVLVVVAYGLILPELILAIPQFGCINIHASLLPRWRGAAPIQRAIEQGDTLSGITIMQMDAGLDTGDILASYPLQMDPQETGQSLHDKLSLLGGQAIVEVLANLQALRLQSTTQDDAQSCYARKLDRNESQINWSASNIDIGRKIRAFNPWPLAKTRLNNTQLSLHAAQIDAPRRLSENREPPSGNAIPGTILAATPSSIIVQCGNGTLRITRLQRPGSKPLACRDFLNGMPIKEGMLLGEPAA